MQKINRNLLKELRKSKYAELLPDFKEEKTQKFTTLVLTIVALSFFSLFAINPTLSTIAKLQKEIEDSKFVHEQLQKKINNLSQLQVEYSKIQDDLPIIYSALPQKSEIPLLIAQIQSLATGSDLTISSLQSFQVEVSEAQNQEKFTQFAFSLNASGSYNDISRFLQSLVKMQRIVNIENVSLTRRTTESEILQLSLRGTAFFKP